MIQELDSREPGQQANFWGEGWNKSLCHVPNTALGFTRQSPLQFFVAVNVPE